MEIIAHHTVEDHLAIAEHLRKRVFSGSPYRRIIGFLVGIYGLCLGYSIILQAQFLDRYRDDDREFISYSLGAILVAMVFLMAARSVARYAFKRLFFGEHGYATSPIKFRLEDQDLVQMQRGTVCRFRWVDFQDTELTKNYIFFYLDRGMAVYISAAAFKDSSQCQAFYNQACNLIANSKS